MPVLKHRRTVVRRALGFGIQRSPGRKRTAALGKGIKMKTMSGFECEFCGYTEPYGDGPGEDCAAVVRARICRHEQLCPENPLVRTINDIRVLLKSTKILPSQVDLCEKLQAAIQMTFDCFGPCVHSNTYTDRVESTDIEVCNDCGASRSVWGEQRSDWRMVDIGAEKSALNHEEHEGKKEVKTTTTEKNGG